MSTTNRDPHPFVSSAWHLGPHLDAWLSLVARHTAEHKDQPPLAGDRLELVSRQVVEIVNTSWLPPHLTWDRPSRQVVGPWPEFWTREQTEWLNTALRTHGLGSYDREDGPEAASAAVGWLLTYALQVVAPVELDACRAQVDVYAVTPHRRRILAAGPAVQPDRGASL